MKLFSHFIFSKRYKRKIELFEIKNFIKIRFGNKTIFSKLKKHEMELWYEKKSKMIKHK